MSKFILTSILAAATVAAIPFASVSAAGYDSKLNQPSYWGDNCVKTEVKGDTMTYSVRDEGVVKVVVKGGTENAVYTSGNYTDLTAPVNPRSGKPYGISHVIVCYGTQTTSEKPAPEKPSHPEKPTTPVVGGDQNGVIETEDQESSTTKTTPQVLGTSQVKGGVTPEALPETGASANTSLLTLLAAIVASGTAYAVALKRQA